MLTLDDFAEKLLREKGLVGLSPAIHVKMKTDLVMRAEHHLNLFLANSLTEAQANAMLRLMDQNPDAIPNFLANCIPDLEENVALALLEFKKIYLG